MSLFIFISILIALIWVHEFGHFIAAKLFGIRVDEFAIGFPPRLWRIKYGETEYTFNLLLVGGFVSIYGENPGTDARDTRSMASKPRLVQAGVIVAGVCMNLVVGWLALSGGYIVGMAATTDTSPFGSVRDIRATVTQVLPLSPAEKVGLMPGDSIDALQTGLQSLGQPLNAETVTRFISDHQNESLVLTVLRNGTEKVFIAKPEAGIVSGKKALGINMADVGILQLPPHLALAQGAISAKQITISTAQGLGVFFSRLLRGVADWSSVAGPVGIVGAGAAAVQNGFSSAVFITALISINLAIINIVPIPGLDGGRLLIILIESILRRPISPKIITAMSLSGFALLVALMLVVTYHDIAKLVG